MLSSKGSSSRQSKKPLVHLKSKKWCFPPSPLLESSTCSTSTSRDTRSPAMSPEPNCAICLGKIEDKSFTDRCFHCFCKTCLFEWAKVKAECPVCRQAFDKIIFNIRAMDDYDEHAVESSHRHRYPLHSSPFAMYSTAIDGVSRFRYPTTLTPLRRRMLDFERRLQMQIHMTDYARHFPDNFLDFLENHRRGRNTTNSIANSVNNNVNNSSNSNTNPIRREDPMIGGQHPIRSTYNPGLYHNHYELDIFPPPAGTSAHRRYIYDSDLWVLTNGDGNTSRIREASARFFSSNPACTHRLIPWLNRELNSILSNPNETESLIPRIMNALLMYDITSVGFKKIIAPFTLNKTNQFIHEFYNFARSPYDMEQYTRIAIYVPRHRATIVESEPLPVHIGYRMEPDSPSTPDSMSSSDSSIEILNDRPNREMPALSPQSPGLYSIDDTNSDVSSTEIRQLITPSPAVTPSLQEGLLIRGSESAVNIMNEMSSTLNPTPIPRGDLPDVNFGNINIIDDFDNPKPGTSGIRLRTTAQTKWSESDTTDIDVGDELEAAIARFEKREVKSEVKKEIKTEVKSRVETTLNDNNFDDSDSNSSVLIVGYVKPLHERTPEFVDLISDTEQVNDSHESKRMKRSKKEKRDKHRKRSKARSHSRSPHSHSHNKRKCKHKSRDRSKDSHKHKYKHKLYRYSKHSRSKSNSSTSESSSSSSSSDELKHLSDSFKKKKHFHHKHRRHSHSRHSRSDFNPFSFNANRFDLNNSSSSLDRKPIASTTTTSTTSSLPNSRPSSISSVVIRKQPLETETIKIKHYYIYSDTD